MKKSIIALAAAAGMMATAAQADDFTYVSGGISDV